jgi:hypothetical protein
MTSRIHARVVRFALAAVAIGAAPVLVAGQAAPNVNRQSSSSAKTGPAKDSASAFRTPWGDPDLQGVWSYGTLTPLERPANIDREFLTPQEAAQRNRESTEDRAPAPGDTGAYNAHWFDRGKVTGDLRTSLIVDPKDGRLPLSEDGKKKVAARAQYRREHGTDSARDRLPWDRCLMYHGVPPISTGYNNSYQIFQTPGQVVILSENIHDVRVIPVNGRSRLGDTIRQWNGSSRGRWEGNTLVVETTNFSDQTELRFPSSPNTRAVERFTRAGKDVIEYEFTIEDPTLYARPWTARRPFLHTPDYKIYEYACHEGNYAMTNILAGARAQEKDAAAAAQSAKGSGAR